MNLFRSIRREIISLRSQFNRLRETVLIAFLLAAVPFLGTFVLGRLKGSPQIATYALYLALLFAGLI